MTVTTDQAAILGVRKAVRPDRQAVMEEDNILPAYLKLLIDQRLSSSNHSDEWQRVIKDKIDLLASVDRDASS